MDDLEGREKSKLAKQNTFLLKIMWLNTPECPDIHQTTLITLEDEKLKTLEGILQETQDIIKFIKNRFDENTLHLVEFEVHGKKIGLTQWTKHGFAQNTYNIPLLFLKISNLLEDNERKNLNLATKPFWNEKYGTDPRHPPKSILSGIHYYLNNPV